MGGARPSGHHVSVTGKTTWPRRQATWRQLILAAGVLALILPMGAAGAQTPEATQQRYINELKQRNADYGAGCNGIGVSLPGTVAMPADLTTRWVGGHSACVPGMRLMMSCRGDVIGDERIVGCLVHVAEGESRAEATCDTLTLITPYARFHPDPTLSRILGEGSESGARACDVPNAFTQDLTLAAAFSLPAVSSTGDLAILLDIDGSEVPAFLIPATQLGLEDAPLGS